MPLATQPGQSRATNQQQQQQQNDYQVKLLHATRQNHPEDQIEMAFVVTDPESGQEQVIKAENINCQQLFEQTEEGQRWLNQTQSNVSRIRRSA